MATSSKRQHGAVYDRINGVLLYAQLQYCLDGLTLGIDDTQALANGRDPDEFGSDDRNKVPAADAEYDGLTQPRFRVVFSRSRPGRAIVTVRWGRRSFGFGPATDVESVTSVTRDVSSIIPWVGKAGGDLDNSQVDLREVKELGFQRAATITTRRVILPSGQSADGVTVFMLENQKKLYPQYGVLFGASVVNINQSQQYVDTQFVNYGAVRGYDAGEVESGSSKIDPLPINGEYKRPDLDNPAAGTEVIDAADVYEPGEDIPWLV